MLFKGNMKRKRKGKLRKQLKRYKINRKEFYSPRKPNNDRTSITNRVKAKKRIVIV